VDINYSSIHDGSGYELYNYSGNDTIKADSCWWGLDDECDSYGLVYITNVQDDTPNWDGDTRTRGVGKAAGNRKTGDDEKRIEELKRIITSNHPYSPEAEDALRELYGILRRDYKADQYGEKDYFYGFLEEIYTDYAKETIGQIALQMMIIWKSLAGETEEAIALSVEGLEILKDTDRMLVLENLTMLYLQMDDLENARKCLEECKEKYSDDKAGIEFLEEELADVEWQINDGIRVPKGSGGYPGMQSEEGTDQDDPGSLDILRNFPNPGNPSTTIRYVLTCESRVTLAVYNVLGEKIRTLESVSKPQGIHETIWDGTDESGRPVSTGIYICRIQTVPVSVAEGKPFSASRKMLMLK
jgi:tetratricopeptide (TPR) repeat protein